MIYSMLYNFHSVKENGLRGKTEEVYMSEHMENYIGHLVLILSHTILRNRNRHLMALGLTAVQADCLRFCLEHGEGTVTDLKNFLKVTHQTAQGLVWRMEKKELLELRRSEKDGRCQIIAMTPKGRAAAEQTVQNRERTGGKLLHGMSPEEQEEFIRLLTLAYENVKND